MIALPDDPDSHLKADQKVKLQAYVLEDDKALLMTVIPNRNLYTLLLTHSVKRTADFIRTHNLDYANDADQTRLLAFIITGRDPNDAVSFAAAPDGLRKRPATRAPRKADARDDRG